MKTLEALKKDVKIRSKIAYNIEGLFSCLLVLGQMRNISLESNPKLCGVPPADGYDFLRKGIKSIIVRKLAITCKPSEPDMVIVGVQELRYHNVWPCGGTVSTIAASMSR